MFLLNFFFGFNIESSSETSIVILVYQLDVSRKSLLNSYCKKYLNIKPGKFQTATLEISGHF